MQWVLHNTPATGARIKAEVVRAGKPVTLTLLLEDGWRQLDDISWRSSAWGLRRMGTAGMKLDTIDGERPAGVPKEGMALLVKHMGMYGGPHGAAKAAGVQLNDVLISFDGRTDLLRETDVFAHALRKTKPGDKVTIKVVRAGKEVEIVIPMQE